MHYTMFEVLRIPFINNARYASDEILFINPFVFEAVLEGARYDSFLANVMQRYIDIADNKELLSLLKFELTKEEEDELIFIANSDECVVEYLKSRFEEEWYTRTTRRSEMIYKFVKKVSDRNFYNSGVNLTADELLVIYEELESIIGTNLLEKIRPFVNFNNKDLIIKLYKLMAQNGELDDKEVFLSVVLSNDPDTIKLCYNLIYITLVLKAEERYRIYRLIMTSQLKTLSDIYETFLQTSESIRDFNKLLYDCEINNEQVGVSDLSPIFNSLLSKNESAPFEELKNLFYISKKAKYRNKQPDNQKSIGVFIERI